MKFARNLRFSLKKKTYNYFFMITIPHTLSPKQQLRFEAENGVLKAIADNYLQLMHHILQEDLQCLLQEKEPDLFLIKDYQSKIQTVLQ